ncbi:MAG TPA: transcriptional repressor [Gemmatimonadaceae bacterium]|nr:transcriptional repressor [Gemmatimonadaceae bacterium]
MERQTRQRTAIERVFSETPRPLDPQEVLTAARRYVPRTGIATVYRAIRALMDEGRVVPVSLPGDNTRYEPAGRDHHHHFQCRRCHKVYELEGCAGDFTTLTPPGFRLEDHEVVLYGRCASCAALS